MKKLTYNHIELEYEIIYDSSGDGETRFYKGTETSTYKKYWLFGKVITVTEPKYVFTIRQDIEFYGYSKEKIREWIGHHILIMKRKEEISRGEII
jgi:hypothetical protein